MVYVLVLVVVAAALLFSVNEFLRGQKKEQIDSWMTAIILVVVVVGFVTGGWRRGVLLLVSALVAIGVFRPTGSRLAARLLSIGRSDAEDHIGLPSAQLQSISALLGRQLGPDSLIAELRSGKPSQREVAESALYEYCERNPATRQVLDSFACGRERLAEIYHVLLALGAGQWAGGHWVAASAIAYPNSLRFVLEHSLEDEDVGTFVTFSLIEYFARGASLRRFSDARPA